MNNGYKKQIKLVFCLNKINVLLKYVILKAFSDVKH